MSDERDLHVIFGMGPAGVAVARSLVQQGVRVRLVSRTGSRRQDLPPTAEVMVADVTDPVQARSAATGAAVLYQCMNAPYYQWPELFPPLQAGILRAALESGARLVALENLYMYGEVSGPMTEDLPYRATTRKGRVRAAMAKELIQAHERGQVSVVIGRASDFYGPGVTESSLGTMVFQPLLQGKASWLIGDPDAVHSYSFIDDVGRGLATLGLNQNASGQIWHLPCAPALSPRTLVAMAAEQVGTVPKVRSLGTFGVRLGSLFSKSAREMVEMLYQFQRPFMMDDYRYRQAFGDQATPYQQGLSETIRWYRTLRQGAAPLRR